MYIKNIRLTKEDIKDFVNGANKCDFDIDIGYNRFVVDAKSIIGVFNLDFTHVLKVTYSTKDEEFERLLERFAV